MNVSYDDSNRIRTKYARTYTVHCCVLHVFIVSVEVQIGGRHKSIKYTNRVKCHRFGMDTMLQVYALLMIFKCMEFR